MTSTFQVREEIRVGEEAEKRKQDEEDIEVGKNVGEKLKLNRTSMMMMETHHEKGSPFSAPGLN